MVDERDPLLQSIFAKTQQELDGELFIEKVGDRIARLKYLVVASGIGLALLLLLFVWMFALPLQGLTVSISQLLTATLVELGDGWVAWILAPVNNIASVLVVSIKVYRMGRKKLMVASFAN